MLCSEDLNDGAAPTCVVLSDCPITAADAMTALTIIGADPRETADPLHVSVVVPPAASGGLIGETVRRLGPSEFRLQFHQQLTALESACSPAPPETVLESVVAAFDAVGCSVSDQRQSPDPIDECGVCVDGCAAQTIIAFTTDAVRDDEFADEWANLMADRAGASVVHLYPAPTEALI